MILSPELLTAISAGGAGLTAVLVIFFLSPLMRAQQATQDKLVDAVSKQVGVNDEMQKGAAARDEQIKMMLRQVRIMLKQTTLIIAAENRNANAAEQQNQKLDSINNATVATGNRMQTLHDGIIGGMNDHGAALGAMGDSFNSTVNESTGRFITALSAVPKAIAEILTTQFDSIDAKLTLLVDGGNTSDLKAEIKQLKEAVAGIPQVLEDCLKQNMLNAKEADAADSTIDKQARQIDLLTHPDPLLSPVDGAANRDLIDGKQVA